MHYFQIHLKETGEMLEKGRPCDWGKISNWLTQFTDKEKKQATFFLQGRKVSFDEIMVACWDNEKKFYCDKQLISWKTGDCENTRQWAWVRK